MIGRKSFIIRFPAADFPGSPIASGATISATPTTNTAHHNALRFITNLPRGVARSVAPGVGSSVSEATDRRVTKYVIVGLNS